MTSPEVTFHENRFHKTSVSLASRSLVYFFGVEYFFSLIIVDLPTNTILSVTKEDTSFIKLWIISVRFTMLRKIDGVFLFWFSQIYDKKYIFM